MYAAFNTLKTKLEDLLKLRESIEAEQSIHISDPRLSKLDAVILSHEQAIKLIVNTHLEQERMKAKRDGLLLQKELQAASNMITFKKQSV